jgi:hypothetical protein
MIIIIILTRVSLLEIFHNSYTLRDNFTFLCDKSGDFLSRNYLAVFFGFLIDIAALIAVP